MAAEPAHTYPHTEQASRASFKEDVSTSIPRGSPLRPCLFRRLREKTRGVTVRVPICPCYPITHASLRQSCTGLGGVCPTLALAPIVGV